MLRTLAKRLKRLEENPRWQSPSPPKPADQFDQLAAYPRNARSHSDAQIEQIAASIREFGFINALLIGPDDVIVAGHARLLAARRLSMTEAPVIVLAHLTDSQRRSLVIADNNWR